MEYVMEDKFLDINEFDNFCNEILYIRRYIHTKAVNEFIYKYRININNNYIILSKGNKYFRAQVGCNEYEKNGKKHREPFQEQRMYPLKKEAKEGRLNPKGISYLYLTEMVENALWEVDAKYKSYVTIAQFKLCNDIKVVYFYNFIELFEAALLSDKNKNTNLTVWNKINLAFSKPVKNTDSTAEYIPTQILAEIIKDEGFDGILYVNEKKLCYNLCLFNVDNAKYIYSYKRYIRSRYFEN